MVCTWKELDRGIRYLPSSSTPLSAEVFLLEDRDDLWLFDVGAGTDILSLLLQLSNAPNIILSHFHPDHTANLQHLPYNQLLVGGFTAEKLHAGQVVSQKMFLADDARLHLFPLPSCHAKGSLGLEVEETFAFLGDGVYTTRKNGKAAYNTTLLKDTISVLEALRAPWFVLSHSEPLVHKKEDVLTFLKGIYAQRTGNDPYIFLK